MQARVASGRIAAISISATMQQAKLLPSKLLAARISIAKILFIIMMAAACLAMPARAEVKMPPLDAYGELPGIEEIIISPGGNRLALLATLNNERLLVIYDLDLKPQLAFPVGDAKVRSIDFIDDERILLQKSSTGNLGFGFTADKFEFWQAIILQVNSGKAEMVFQNKPMLVDATFGYHGTRLVDGRPTAFFGAIELSRSTRGRTGYQFDHGRPALYAVDLLDNAARRVAVAPHAGFTRDWLVGAGGQILATLDTSLSRGSWKIRGTDGVIAEGLSATGRIRLVTIGRDGRSIIYSTRDDETGETQWFEVPVDGSGEPQEVFADVDIERLFLGKYTGQLIGYLVQRQDLEPVFFDPELEKKAKMIRAAFAQYKTAMVDWTPGFEKVLVRTNGNGDSGSFYKVDIAALQAEAVGWERPLIPPDMVGQISRVEYTAGDGLEMDGILTLPPGREARNLPLVMLPHGGPHSQDDETFDWWAQAFASRGYAVFQPNFRGSTNRNEAFVQAGYGEWGKKMQSDISDGMAMLAEKGIIDPDRACIMGASYGGYAALAGVTLQQGLYRCAVSVAGVADVSLMSRLENREAGNNKVRSRSLQQQLGPSSNFKAISPRHNAHRADAPILLIHGRDDTVVHYQQSVKMADALKDAGKYYEFVELEGEDHWLSLGETRKKMLHAAMAFILKYNPPD